MTDLHVQNPMNTSHNARQYPSLDSMTNCLSSTEPYDYIQESFPIPYTALDSLTVRYLLQNPTQQNSYPISHQLNTMTTVTG